MRILIIGATGFLGQKIAKNLQSEGHTVIVSTRKEALKDRRETYFCDIEQEKYDAINKFAPIDVLVFLAWTKISRADRNSDIHTEFRLKTQKYFETILVNENLKIVVAGSCDEYGLKEGICSEDEQILPVTRYGIEKNELRKFLDGICLRSDSRLLWLRYFYLFGSGDRNSNLFTQISEANARGEQHFTMQTSGLWERDYLSAIEATRISAQLISNHNSEGIYNIGSGVAVSMREIIARWKSENKWKIDLIYNENIRQNLEPYSQFADISKLSEILL
jgi:nucleoside-diphosphate-sugar epimerase